MNKEQMKSLAEALGEPLGEVAVSFLMIVNALRNQPAFDDAKFRAEVEALLARGDLSRFQRNMLSSLLD